MIKITYKVWLLKDQTIAMTTDGLNSINEIAFVTYHKRMVKSHFRFTIIIGFIGFDFGGLATNPTTILTSACEIFGFMNDRGEPNTPTTICILFQMAINLL
jgi:hypothetical protein